MTLFWSTAWLKSAKCGQSRGLATWTTPSLRRHFGWCVRREGRLKTVQPDEAAQRAEMRVGTKALDEDHGSGLAVSQRGSLPAGISTTSGDARSEEHTSELQSQFH